MVEQLQLLADDPGLLETLTAETNKKLQQGRPKLERQKAVLHKELMQLVLQRAEVNEREITLEVFALTEAEMPGKVAAEGDVVRIVPGWLPGQDSNLRPSG